MITLSLLCGVPNSYKGHMTYHVTSRKTFIETAAMTISARQFHTDDTSRQAG